jgi:hypothetical protein
MIDNAQTLQILTKVWQTRPVAFTGLGLVFYLPPANLPSMPLLGDVSAPDVTPVRGLENIASCLASISDYRSPWHDGFHFIDAVEISLTHLAQYLAPPLSALPSDIDRPSGARHMTALMTSFLISVKSVSVMSTTGEICLYAGGQLSSKFQAQP